MSVLSYPCLLLGFCSLLLLALFGFVVPSLAELFEGRTLPSTTAAIFAISHVVTHHAALIAVVVLGGSTAIWGWVCFGRGRARIHAWIAKIPFVGQLIFDTALTRWCQTMGVLLKAGVSLVDALQLSVTVVANPLLESKIEQARQVVLGGGPLSGALTELPLMVSRFIVVAEKTGRLDRAFETLGQCFEEETARHRLQLTAILQPALLVFLGLIVGGTVLAVLLPLTDVSTLF